MSVLNPTEKDWLRKYATGGKSLIVTGTHATQLGDVSGVVRFENCPGKAYTAALQKDFEHTLPDSQAAFLRSLKRQDTINILASPLIATSIAQVDGSPHVYLANFAGLKGGVNPVQTPQTGVRIAVPATAKGKAFFLPFLGEVQELNGGLSAGYVSYRLPPISKGAVFWYQPSSEPGAPRN